MSKIGEMSRSECKVTTERSYYKEYLCIKALALTIQIKSIQK